MLNWPAMYLRPLVQLIPDVPSEHSCNVDMEEALLGCVCPYSVCLALPVTGGGRAQCVIGFEGSAALTFWAAGANRGRKVCNAQRPGQGQPGTSLYVGAALCLSTSAVAVPLLILIPHLNCDQRCNVWGL